MAVTVIAKHYGMIDTHKVIEPAFQTPEQIRILVCADLQDVSRRDHNLKSNRGVDGKAV